MADKDTLRKFYFSGGTNFNAFKSASEKKTSHSPTGTTHSTSAGPATVAASTSKSQSPLAVRSVAAPSPTSAPGDVSTSNIDVVLPSMIEDASLSAGRQTSPIAGGNSLNAIRTISNKGKMGSTSTASSSAAPAAAADAASAEYFQFLKQQQDIQRSHQRLEEVLANWVGGRRERQAELTKMRAHCAEVLSDIETAVDWKLKSKYDVQQLIRDCNLALQPTELVEDRPSQHLAVEQIATHLTRIERTYGGTLQFKPYKLNHEQSLRRLHLLVENLHLGNMDASNLARIADTMIVQLENVCQLTTLEDMVKDREASIERHTFAVEDMRTQRDVAVSDGEVHVAERLCYDIIDALESTLGEVVGKAETLQSALQENEVMRNVSDQYHKKTPEELSKLHLKCSKLRQRCLEDMKKMFALREKVEEVESQTAAKVLKDREASDRLLTDNQKRLETVFAKMEELEREAEQLERERHRELLKRLSEKDKDEHRRAEFARFCHVVDSHAAPLERTVKNMDIMLSSVEAMRELLDNTFNAIHDDLTEREKLLREVKIETHKEHVEVFRAMLLETGEIIYRKERMVEELDKKVQQAHVQQELLAETFNPNAKKFGDIKKQLLQNRDDLEADIEDLKRRAGAGLSQFAFSEKALDDANVTFVHPATEQEHHTIAMRAKMVEFKAMLLGHTVDQPILSEIGRLKEAVQETAAVIAEVNADTSGNIAKSLPVIQAANRTRFRQ